MDRGAKIISVGKLCALAAVLLAFSAAPWPLCAADPEQGILEIQIKDHRDAIRDFAKIEITIDKIAISPKPGLLFWQKGWKELIPKAATVDLTQYTGKKTVSVFRGAIDTGAFDAFHLRLKSIDSVLNTVTRDATVKNTLRPVKLSFEVSAKGETLLIIDLTVTDMSDHPPRGYELSIRGYELYTNGKLLGKIPPG